MAFRTSDLAAASCAFWRCPKNVGMAMAAKMAMMMITTKSSMRVKPPSPLILLRIFSNMLPSF